MQRSVRKALTGGFLGVLLGAAVLTVGGSGAAIVQPGGTTHLATGIWERTSGSLPLDEDGLPLTYVSIGADGSFTAYRPHFPLFIIRLGSKIPFTFFNSVWWSSYRPNAMSWENP